MDYAFDRQAAAVYLRISQSTLDHLCGARSIAFVKLGRRSYFSQEDLDAFVASRRIEARPAGAAAR